MRISKSLKVSLAASAAAVATFAAAGAHAAVLYSGPASINEMVTNTSFDVMFNAPSAGAGGLSFVLDGYASLDGDNWYEDDFTLSLNSAPIFKATFNLGGGGHDVVYQFLSGATWVNLADNGVNHDAINWNGGHVNIATPLSLSAGANTLTFAYEALPYNEGQNAGWQVMSDEGWSAHDIVVTSPATVPEPATWAMLLMGFFGLGSLLRQARRQPVPVRIRA